MSKYNKYAKRLDEAFKQARDTYAEAYLKFEKAKEDKDNNSAYKVGESEYSWRRRKTEAEIAFIEAEEEFKVAKKESWVDFQTKAENLKAELYDEIMNDGLVNPDALDTNAIELLKSGVMTVDDMENFAIKYDGNATMMKLISKYANDMASNADTAEERRRLNTVSVITSKEISTKVQEFNSIFDAAMIYAGLTRKDNLPEFIITMNNRWEDVVSEAIENF